MLPSTSPRLEGFQAAEVDGGLDLWGIPTRAASLDLDGYRSLSRLGLYRSREPLVGEERRVDPPGEVPQVVESPSGLGLQFDEHLSSPIRVLTHEVFGKPLLDGQSHELLLRAVVDVPSIFRLSSSWAATSLWREARSSSINRTFRSTAPACEARASTSRSRAR